MLKLGVLKLVVDANDDLAVDDVAHVVVSPPRRAQVLVVTLGNEPLEYFLQLETTIEIADVLIESPDYLEKEEYRNAAAAGVFDLVIYDRCAPAEMPRANTMFIGDLPLDKKWGTKPEVPRPIVINTKVTHPLLQWVDLVGDVDFAAGTPLVVPRIGKVLVDADEGPLMAIAPREQFEDLVLGFLIFGEVTGEGDEAVRHISTNWSIRPSFAMFMINVFHYLGGSQGAQGSQGFMPGETVSLKGPSPQSKLRVKTPSGETVRLEQRPLGGFDFTDTADLGVYEVSADGKSHHRFAVNLFDRRESNLTPQPSIEIGWVESEANADREVARQEIWRWLLLIGLAVLLLEWYIYNRRVYV